MKLKPLFFLFLILFLFNALYAQRGLSERKKAESSKASGSSGELEVRKMLQDQLLSWNAGDLIGFMDSYWKNDSLMFIGKSGVTYGWENTLNNYKRSYADTTEMGKLNFNIIEIKRLSVIYFSVVGKWELTRTVGNLKGHFTLLIKKVKNKWVIVSDHSS